MILSSLKNTNFLNSVPNNGSCSVKLLSWAHSNASVKMDIPGEVQTPVPCQLMMENNLHPLGWIALRSRMQIAQTVLVSVPAKVALLCPINILSRLRWVLPVGVKNILI